MPKRRPDHMEGQRERILAATLQCISELGIERTSIAEIRKLAGLSTGAIYTHFAGKDEIVAEALRSASVRRGLLPETWREFAAAIARVGDGEADVLFVARTQLQIYASAIRPGPLHDLLKPILANALDVVVRHLENMEREGHVKLRSSALKTALAMGAIRDGIMWSGLALDRPLDEIEADIVDALGCLVDVTAG